MMYRCPDCGAYVEPDEKYCGVCGHRMADPLPPAPRPKKEEVKTQMTKCTVCRGTFDAPQHRSLEECDRATAALTGSITGRCPSPVYHHEFRVAARPADWTDQFEKLIECEYCGRIHLAKEPTNA